MIQHRIALKGILQSFGRDRVAEVNFDALPGSGALISLVGPNGCGKTHLMGVPPAIFYQEFPYYSANFADHVIPGVRDAFAENEFTVGHQRYRARIQADPQFSKGRGKTEAFLWRVGEPKPFAGPLLGDFNREIAKLVPAKSLFYSSAFAPQGGGGSFFKLTPALRKDLFLSMLGGEIGRAQGYSKMSGERAAEVLRELTQVRRDLETAAGKVARATELDAEIAGLEEGIAAEQAAVVEKEGLLEAQRSAAAAIRDELAKSSGAARSIEVNRMRLESDRLRHVSARDAAQQTLDELKPLLARKSEIETAADTLEALDRELHELEALERQRRADLQPLQEDASKRAQAIATLRAEYQGVCRDLDAAEAAAKRAEGYDELVAHVASLEAIAVQRAGETEGLDTSVTIWEQTAKTEAEQIANRRRLSERLADLKPRIEKLAQIDLDHPMCSACPLTGDARAARDTLLDVQKDLDAIGTAEGTPAADTLKQFKAELATSRKRLESVQRDAGEARAKLAGLESDRRLATTVGLLAEREAEMLANGTAKKVELEQVNEAVATKKAALDKTIAGRIDVFNRRSAAAKTAGKLADLRATEAHERELRKEFDRAEAELAAVDAQLQALPPKGAADPRVKELEDLTALISTLDAEIKTLQKNLAARRDVAARAAGERQSIGEAQAKAEELRARDQELSSEAADWAVLETGLGRNGVQALEIAAAGPGVAALTNDLLATCDGPRFSIALETLAETQKGEQRETFYPRIIDSELGTIELGSGGEMVIIDAAFRIAISLYQADRSGYELRTLWLDETAQALSPQRANVYVAMLRRAAKLGNFDRVIFTSHSREVWQQADARIFVQGGEIITRLAGQPDPEMMLAA